MSGEIAGTGRHCAWRIIKASPRAIYRAFLDPEAAVQWRAPHGMTAEIQHFEPHQGGAYRMAFIYEDISGGSHGKTTERADVFDGVFAGLDPDRRIVERVKFQSDDPAFAEEMTVITTLTPVGGATRVDVRAENVPAVISEADHAVGMASSLENLAAFTE